MKTFLLFLKIAAIMLTPNASSQTIIKCSDQTTYWIIPDNTTNYIVTLKGDIDLSNQPDVLNIDDKALQYVILDKHPYTARNSKNEDSAVLIKYTEMESDYLQEKFNEAINIYSEIHTITTGQTAILWYFDLPHGKNNEVVAQLFANIIIDDKIFGLGVPLFAGQDFNATKSFLLQAIATISKVKNPNGLCSK